MTARPIAPTSPLTPAGQSLAAASCSLFALDLFCCAGGAGMGLHQAGFDVTGVDIVGRPNYPFKFILGDALEADLSGFDFVWASPPCQAHTTLKHRTGKEYECFITRTREKLKAWGGPYIIENVMGSPLENPIMLCGSSFGLGVRRHRLFESNVFLWPMDCRHDLQPEPLDITGTGSRRKGERLDGKGGNSRKPRNLQEARDAMEMPWATRKEISQAIPPAFSRYLGEQVAKFCKANVKAQRPEPENGNVRKSEANACDVDEGSSAAPCSASVFRDSALGKRYNAVISSLTSTIRDSNLTLSFQQRLNKVLSIRLANRSGNRKGV